MLVKIDQDGNVSIDTAAARWLSKAADVQRLLSRVLEGEDAETARGAAAANAAAALQYGPKAKQ